MGRDDYDLAIFYPHYIPDGIRTIKYKQFLFIVVFYTPNPLRGFFCCNYLKL
jgi:hypothetical protein